MHPGFSMRASRLQRARYMNWTGPVVTNASLNRPYVFSDPVPLGQKWIILAASAIDSLVSQEDLALYAILAPNATRNDAQSISRPDFLSFDGINTFNAPPVLRPSVLLSKGGTGAHLSNEMMSIPAVALIGGNSVNLLAPNYRNFALRSSWMLAVIQDNPSTGLPTAQGTLSVII